MSVYKISGSWVSALTEFEEIEVEVQVDFPTIS